MLLVVLVQSVLQSVAECQVYSMFSGAAGDGDP